MSRSSLSPGDIVLIPHFPFTNYFETKSRPALVLSSARFNQSCSDVILASISSNTAQTLEHDVVVFASHPGFLHTGLKKSSTIKCGVIIAFSQAQIDRKLGVLPEPILAEVRKVLSIILEIGPGIRKPGPAL